MIERARERETGRERARERGRERERERRREKEPAFEGVYPPASARLLRVCGQEVTSPDNKPNRLRAQVTSPTEY